jgi:SAM-dependent methyltransferase
LGISSAASRIEMEDRPCPLGCDAGDEALFVGRERLFNKPGKFQVVKCCTCGLIRTNPRPTNSAMSLYYPDGYGPYRIGRLGPYWPEPWWQRSAIRTLNLERLPAIPPGRLLEFGCGSGWFLQRMAGHGWEVEGIEISPTAGRAAQALGFSVHIGAVEDVPAPSQPYDLVVGWMVLEHLYDPLKALVRLLEWTRPGGWLVLSVPDAASLGFRLFRNAWYDLDLPRHLFHFTVPTLRRVLDASGWQMERVLYQRSVNNLVASLGCKLQDTRAGERFPRLTNALLRFPYNARLRYLTYPLGLFPLGFLLALFGQTGRVTVWATGRR